MDWSGAICSAKVIGPFIAAVSSRRIGILTLLRRKAEKRGKNCENRNCHQKNGPAVSDRAVHSYRLKRLWPPPTDRARPWCSSPACRGKSCTHAELRRSAIHG